MLLFNFIIEIAFNLTYYLRSHGFTREHLRKKKNTHSTITPENRCHACRNFTDHSVLGNYLLKSCPQLVNQPVCVYIYVYIRARARAHTHTHTHTHTKYRHNVHKRNSFLTGNILFSHRKVQWFSIAKAPNTGTSENHTKRVYTVWLNV